MSKKDGLFVRNGVNLLVPFILVTSCFALWGFANDVTNPMVKAFSKIFLMSVTEGTLVQVAFYGGYFAMAFPAAMFIQKYSYKAGVMVGLGLYALGALLFIPACAIGIFYPFLAAYFIMTCGLSFLETSCNPYIYSMGSDDTATQRLNFAQAFNPMGSLCGMFVAREVVQAGLDPMETTEREALLATNPEAFEALKDADLEVLIQPYYFIGLIVLVMLAVVFFKKMPAEQETASKKSAWQTLKELALVKNYREGVIAQFFYVGAQIMCWTFIIQYGTRVFMAEGMAESEAEQLSSTFNIIAMVFFLCSRFICTYFLKYIQPGRLLSILGVGAIIATAGVILFTNRYGVYCLVAVSGCMSLMFPTIYGIALRRLGDNIKFGAAGLIMSILGGSVLPVMQSSIIDSKVEIAGLPSTNLSFIIPLFCFVVIVAYGIRAYNRNQQYLKENAQ